MHPNLPEKIPLHGADGALLEYVDEHQARELIKAGVVDVLRTKKRVRSLRFREVPRRPSVVLLKSKWDLATRKRPLGQSHNRENDQNPPGVWTIDRIPEHAAQFFAVARPARGKRAA